MSTEREFLLEILNYWINDDITVNTNLDTFKIQDIYEAFQNIEELLQEDIKWQYKNYYKRSTPKD